MDMFCTERGSPHIAGVKITLRSHRSQQPDTRSYIWQLEVASNASCYSESQMPNLTTAQNVILWKRPTLAEQPKTRAPNQLPSEAIKRNSVKMREGLLHPFSMLVHS